MVTTPKLKDVKSTAITAGEVVAGFIAGHAIKGAIKSTNKFIHPGATIAALIAHAALKNEHAKAIALGAGVYFGIKSLNDLKEKAVSGLDGLDGFKEFLNKVVPGLGEVDFQSELSGQELDQAERDLLGILGSENAEFTPYTEVSSAPMGSVSNL